MNPEIAEYKEFEDQLRQNLEGQYQYHIATHNYEAAHEVVKSMMEYRIIAEDDPRVSPDTKIFGKDINPKKPEFWGTYDYRRKGYSSYIPKYLFCNLKYRSVITSPTLDHWGKRVEGNFEGGIKITAFNRQFCIELANTARTVRNAMDDIASICKNYKMTFSAYNSMLEMALAGVVRIYKIEVMGNIESRYRLIGYSMLKMDESGAMVARTLLKYEALYNNWIDIRKFINAAESAIKNCCSIETKFSLIIDPASALEKQDNMIKSSIASDKHFEIVKAQTEAAEAAKAAKKTAREAKINAATQKSQRNQNSKSNT